MRGILDGGGADTLMSSTFKVRHIHFGSVFWVAHTRSMLCLVVVDDRGTRSEEDTEVVAVREGRQGEEEQGKTTVTVAIVFSQSSQGRPAWRMHETTATNLAVVQRAATADGTEPCQSCQPCQPFVVSNNQPPCDRKRCIVHYDKMRTPQEHFRRHRTSHRAARVTYRVDAQYRAILPRLRLTGVKPCNI